MKSKAFHLAFISLLLSTSIALSGCGSKNKNFLIGLCDIALDKNLKNMKTCTPDSASNQNVFLVFYTIFTEKHVNANLVFGKKSQRFPANRRKNKRFLLPATYEIKNENEIIVSATSPNGCINISRYTKVNKDIFKEGINQKGTCGPNQKAAHKVGLNKKIKIHYVKMN